MTRMRALALAGFAAVVSGCARSVQAPPPTPADIPALEAARQQRPNDGSVLTRLGIAYYDAKDFTKARDALRATLVIEPTSYAAAVYLGLSYEELGNLDSARVSYNRASAMRITSSQREELTARLTLLTRKELQQDARNAVAQEATLTQSAPVENTIAVFPFRYRGANEELRPLERGLSQLIVTDLSKVARLRLLERERVQALLDEMQLTDSGRVQTATGARSGRMLRAASVVQGTLQDQPGNGSQLRLDANVINATNASVTASGAATDRLQQLFEVEKQVVLQLLQRMGITLSAAERRAISERPTADLQAFLAYSRGLEAEDRGDFQAAADQFSAAVARDPNFRSAKNKQAQNQRMAAAMGTTPAQLAGIQGGVPTGSDQLQQPGTSTPRVITLRNVITGSVPSHGGLITGLVGSQPPVQPPSLPEAIQTDDPRTGGLIGQIIIIITRP
jgi:TolB-like protein